MRWEILRMAVKAASSLPLAATIPTSLKGVQRVYFPFTKNSCHSQLSLESLSLLLQCEMHRTKCKGGLSSQFVHGFTENKIVNKANKG